MNTVIWPQVTVLVLMLIGLGINMAEHGEEKTEKKNFWVRLLSAGLTFWLLYVGGFFSVLNF